MPRRRLIKSNEEETRIRPATTPEDRENQMIHLADQLAQKQLIEGTASAQVITHFLKLGSSRERLEQERLKGQIELDQAKAEQIQAMQRQEELFAKAILAMRSYSGQAPPPGEEDEY